jgi:hypothetical protein
MGISASQPLISLSSGESEFASQVRGIIEGLYLRNLIHFFEPEVTITLEEDKKRIQYLKIVMENDSSASRGMLNRLGVSKRTKHITTKLFWVQQLVHNKIVELAIVRGRENESDIGTKYLARALFHKFVAFLGMELLGPTIPVAKAESTALVAVMKKARRFYYSDWEMQLEALVLGAILGAAMTLVILNMWAMATTFYKRCCVRRTPVSTLDMMERIHLDKIYKTRYGVKLHCDLECQHMRHVGERQRREATIEWCSDCRRGANRTISMEIGV